MADKLWMDKVEQIAANVAQSEGCVLYDLDFIGAGKGRTLRIFIDKEAEGGISLTDCSNVSKGVNQFLDENEELIPGGAYHLEVSSPGMERQLSKPWHFEKVVGKKVLVKTSKALECFGVTDKKWKAAKTVEEVLESVSSEGIRFVVKETEIKIPFDVIEKAKLVFEMNKGQKK